MKFNFFHTKKSLYAIILFAVLGLLFMKGALEEKKKLN